MVQKDRLRSFSPEKAMIRVMRELANMEKMTPTRMMVWVEKLRSKA